MRRERISANVDVLRLSPEEVRTAIADWVRKQQPEAEVTQVTIFDWYFAERCNVDVMIRTVR